MFWFSIYSWIFDCRARSFTFEMKRAAIQALADLAKMFQILSWLHTIPKFYLDQTILSPNHSTLVFCFGWPWQQQRLLKGRTAPIQDIGAYLQRLERLLEKTKEVIRPLSESSKKLHRGSSFLKGTMKRFFVKRSNWLMKKLLSIVLGDSEIQQVAESINILQALKLSNHEKMSGLLHLQKTFGRSVEERG